MPPTKSPLIPLRHPLLTPHIPPRHPRCYPLLTLFLLLLTLLSTPFALAKSAGNGPYVATFGEQSPFYARCIPEETTGSKGLTQILKVQKDGDQLITSFNWYNLNGLVLGWSPIAGKVGILRIKQESALPPDKQIELSLYLGDQLLRSYTTNDLLKLGARLEPDMLAFERGLGTTAQHAAYTVQGCFQVWNTNDYYYRIKLDETHTLNLDLLTGKPCRIEKAEKNEILIPLEK